MQVSHQLKSAFMWYTHTFITLWFVIFLYSMCELHESNLKIGSNPEALEQFISIAYFTISPWCAQAPLNLFACLSHTREVHPYLASNSVVDGILDVCEYRSKLGDSTMDLLLLR